MRGRILGAGIVAGLALAAPPASAAVLMGEPTLTGAFTLSCIAGCIAGPGAAPAAGGIGAAPFSGVLVHWRANAASPAGQPRPLTLRTYAPLPANKIRLSRTGTTAATTADGLFSIVQADTATPIAKGEQIGIDGSASWSIHGVNVGVTGASILFTTSTPRTDGATADTSSVPNVWATMNADLESDVDGDGFGDETQDQCPTDRATQGPCPVVVPQTIQVPVTVPVPVPAPVEAQPDAQRATVSLARNRRSLSVRLTCPASRSQSCAGVVRAQTTKAVELRGSTRRRPRRAIVVLGSGGFSAAPGAVATARIALSGAARALFGPGKRVGVAALVQPVDGPVGTRRVTVRVPRR